MSEWQKIADIEAVRVDRDGQGEISPRGDPIQVKINHWEELELRFTPETTEYQEGELEELAEQYDPGELIDTEYRGGAYARLKYAFDDGVARVVSFKDVSSEASSSGWEAFDFIKLLPVADEAVARVPGVERVEKSATVLGELHARGEEIEIDQA